MRAVGNKLTLLSHWYDWLAYDDLGQQPCYCCYTRDKNVWMTQHSTRGVYNSRSSENIKSNKTLGGWETHWGSLHHSPCPIAGPPQSPTRSQHLGLPGLALGAEATEGSHATVEPGPLRALLRHRLHDMIQQAIYWGVLESWWKPA